MRRDPGEMVNQIVQGVQAAGVYFAEHPRVAQAAARAAAEIEAALAEDGEDRLFLGVADRHLVFEGRLLLGPTLMAKKLIDRSEQFGSGGFVFRRGVSAAEFSAFFVLCGTSRAKPEGLDEARRLLVSRGVVSIELAARGAPGSGATLVSADLRDIAAAESALRLEGAISAYQHLRESVEGAHAAAEAGRSVDLAECRGVVESLLAGMSARPADILHLARYPDYDSYTVGHSVRVALLALLVGRRLGAGERALLEIGTACLLHDVGKSQIPQEILFKRGRLDDDERRRMSEHPAIGAKILVETADAGPFAVAAAFGHHLRHDGGGYPSPAPWQKRGRVTGLVQACDVFEALTAIRPYKPALAPARALEIMLADRAAFDPWAFAALVSAVGLYPPGSRVRLETGELAVVLQAGRHLDRPIVEVTRGADGCALSPADRRVVDLAAPSPGAARRVEEIVFDDVVTGEVRVEDRSAASDEPAPCCAPGAHAH